MSITTLTRHPFVACAETVSSAVEDVRDVQPVFMSTEEKERAVLALERAERQLAEVKLRVLAAADDVAEAHGARDVAAWFAHVTRNDLPVVRAEVELAKAMDSRWGKLQAGMAGGGVSLPQAQVIRRALEDLPAAVDAEVVSSAEGLLVGYAADYRPAELRRLGRKILEVVAPDIVDEEEAKRLRREEERARAKAYLRFRRLGDGTSRVNGLFPDAVVDRLRTYVDAYTSPRKADDAVYGEEDRIPADRKAAHAFEALLEHLDPANLPEHGGDATTILVTLSHEQLLTQLATAGMLDADLDTGANLTAEQARRLACTAKIIPVVLGGKGEILDLGRARRLFSPAQRKAIRLRDKHCRAEGCTIPATWTEAHHLTPWSEGGTTNLHDAISLCNHHHHRIHDHRYTHDKLPNGDIRFHRRT
jgi:hypothetical protein